MSKTVQVQTPLTDIAVGSLRAGDEIVSVDERRVEDWSALADALSKGDGTKRLVVRRGGAESSLEAVFSKDESFGIVPEVEPVIGDVVAGGPGEKAGLRRGDRVVAVGSARVDGWSDLRSAVEAMPGEKTMVEVVRDGEPIRLDVSLDEVEEKGPDGESRRVGKLQVAPWQERHRLNPFAAVREGVKQTVWVIGNVFEFLRILFSGRVTADMVGGPVSIFHISGESARKGLDTLLSLLAFLSVELGILNLLPIPVLDGGHLVFLGIEGARRKPLSVKQRVVLQQIGLAVILLVMVTVTVFDVGRLLR